jgi:hypothetical protein
MDRSRGDHEDAEQLFELLGRVKPLAAKYYRLTGRPLGITAEVAEYEAARLLGVELSPVRQSGYDAIRRVGRRKQYLQIKGRCLPKGTKPRQPFLSTSRETVLTLESLSPQGRDWSTRHDAGYREQREQRRARRAGGGP